MKPKPMATDAKGRYLIPFKEFAARLCISRKTVYRKIADGELPPPIKQGRLSYYAMADAEAYIANLERKLERRTS